MDPCETILSDMQADIGDRLRSDTYLASIPVFDEEKGDLASEVQIALGLTSGQQDAYGACLVVLSPIGNDDNPDTPGGPLDIHLAVRVCVDPKINNVAGTGTQIKALTLARRVHRCLKHFASQGRFVALCPERPSIVPVEDGFAPVAYEVRFTTRESDPGRYAKLQAVSISPATGVQTYPVTVTLACNTAGAAIYYTLDGSYPRSGNAAAILYTAPFSVTAAKTVRAAGYKTGWLPGDVTQSVYT
ncbi:MAG: chitobiase/beta-hexosaminidase C-terminal domain-containing protein [Verrucomicrobiota bacterium]